MTADELRTLFNNTFGTGEWPKTYEVDTETYANVCQKIFNVRAGEIDELFWNVVENGVQKSDMRIISLAVGPNNGILFKGVELLIK